MCSARLLQQFSNSSGSGQQATSGYSTFLPNTTRLSACAIVGNGNQCIDLDLVTAAPPRVSCLLASPGAWWHHDHERAGLTECVVARAPSRAI